MAKKNSIYNVAASYFNNDAGTSMPQNSMNDNRKIIIRGNSPQDIHRKSLEIQQKHELERKFFSTVNTGFQKAMQYEAARLPAYMDYEGMEYYPLIAAALDLFMEEATSIGFDGKMLSVYSNKDRIKGELENFFQNIVNVNVNLPFWTRNMIKFGDNMVLQLGEKGKGITHIRQMVNYDMERIEKMIDGVPKTIFKQRQSGEEFNSFEIAHFRLLGDDKFLPYGCSILSKVRRVFRQCLDQNSLIWTPTGGKPIKDINIGDVVYSYNTNDETYFTTNVKNISNNGLKNRYEIKTRHRNITLTNDHPILVKNNNGYEYKSLEEITVKTDSLVLPMIDDNNTLKHTFDGDNYYVELNDLGKVFVKTIPAIGIMKKIDELELITTRKNVHSFLRGYSRKIKYNDFIKVRNMFLIDENMYCIKPYGKNKSTIVNNKLEYELNDNFIKFFGFMLGDGWINYHCKRVSIALGEYDDQNEYYINLFKTLTHSEPIILKVEGTKSASASVNSLEFIKILEKFGFITGHSNKVIPEWVFGLSKHRKLLFIRGIFDADGCDNNGLYSSVNFKMISQLRELAQSCGLKVGNVLMDRKPGIYFSKSFNKNMTRKQSYMLYIKYNENVLLDHNQFEKITQINELGEDTVWDIEVDNEYHNFIAEGIVVHNCIMAEDAMLTNRLLRAADRNLIKVGVGNMDDDDVDEYLDRVGNYLKRQPRINAENGQIDYRFNVVNNDEDIILPVRNGDNQTGIEKLEGMSNFDKIQDIEYLRQNLCAGLGVPKPFLLFDDASGGGKNMAQHDIRFAKKVARIQQALIQELNKMAITHLLLLGYDSNDITNFKLTLTNPSTQQEQLKVELLQTKAQVYSEVTRNEGGISAMSHTLAKRLLFNMSDREIIEDFRRQRMERAISQELQDTPLIIKRTGVFDPVDDKYSVLKPLVQGSAEIADNINVQPNETPAGAEFQNPNELPEPQGTAQENYKINFENVLHELVGSDGRSTTIQKHMISETEFTDINETFIDKANQLYEETESILTETKSFNTKNNVFEFDDEFKDILTE